MTVSVEPFKLADGQPHSVTISIAPTYDTTADFYTGSIKIRGLIEYADDAGLKRQTGFVRTFEPKSGHFRKSDNPEDEFEDQSGWARPATCQLRGPRTKFVNTRFLGYC
jgi:hypothetical protein